MMIMVSPWKFGGCAVFTIRNGTYITELRDPEFSPEVGGLLEKREEAAVACPCTITFCYNPAIFEIICYVKK